MAVVDRFKVTTLHKIEVSSKAAHVQTQSSLYNKYQRKGENIICHYPGLRLLKKHMMERIGVNYGIF
jgi:hypothetical protein